MLELRITAEGLWLKVKARAGGKSNQLTGVHDGMIKVSVTQVAEKGKANAAIRELLAAKLQIAKSSIELVSGATNSQKTFLIQGLDSDTVRQRLNAD